MALTIHVQGNTTPYAVGFPTIDLTLRQVGMVGMRLVTDADKRLTATFDNVPPNDNLLPFLHKFARNMGPEEWILDLDANDSVEMMRHAFVVYMKMGFDCMLEGLLLRPFDEPSHDESSHVDRLPNTPPAE